VSVQLGEAVTVAQDRPVIATISDVIGTLRSRQCTLIDADYALENFQVQALRTAPISAIPACLMRARWG
jgi:hypothetical protein